MRGSEKKIIYVKDTGSKIFEEAYFVIRRGVDEGEGRPSENDMVREATRIVSQNSAAYPAARRRREPPRPHRSLAGHGFWPCCDF